MNRERKSHSYCQIRPQISLSMSSSKYRLLNCLDLQKQNIIGGYDNMVRYYLHVSQCQSLKESEFGE